MINAEAERQQQLKERGMTLAAAHNEDLLAEVKALAESIAMLHLERLCSMNDVRAHYKGKVQPRWGAWCGSIFKGPEWEFTGRREAANYPLSHGREVKIWRLR